MRLEISNGKNLVLSYIIEIKQLTSTPPLFWSIGDLVAGWILISDCRFLGLYRLWLPTETVLQDLGSTSFDGFLSRTVANSWFSMRLFSRQNKNLQSIYTISSTYFPKECTDLEAIKSKSVKLLVTPEQHRKFKHWHDVSRWVFNQALAFIRDYQTCEELGIKKPSWMDIKKTFTQTLPIWTKDVPFQIKGIAVKEAVEAYWATLKAQKGQNLLQIQKLERPRSILFYPKNGNFWQRDLSKNIR